MQTKTKALSQAPVKAHASLLRRGSSVRYINPLCEVYRRRKVEWIDQAENLCQMYVWFLVHPCRFLVHRWISRLWLNLTAWNAQKLIGNYVAAVCICFYFIFSKKRSIVFYFEGPPETRGGSCAFSLGITIMWRSIRSFTVLFKSCIFMVNMNLDKTILQSNILHFAYSFYLQS